MKKSAMEGNRLTYDELKWYFTKFHTGIGSRWEVILAIRIWQRAQGYEVVDRRKSYV